MNYYVAKYACVMACCFAPMARRTAGLSSVVAMTGDNSGRNESDQGASIKLAETFYSNVNYLTPLNRFVNDAAERGRMGRPSGKCRLTVKV
jgi:hypothetical protein